MNTESLKFRFESSLAQRFRSVVTTSQLHCAMMNISHGTNTYPKVASGKKIDVYVVIFNVSKDPQSCSKAYKLLEQHFTLKELDRNHFYVS